MSTRSGQLCPKGGEKGCRAAWWCEKFSSIPEKGLFALSQASLSLAQSEGARLFTDVMAELQIDELELQSRLDGAWRRVAEGKIERGAGFVPSGFSKPVPSPPAAAPALPSGLQASSSSGWTSSHF